MVIQENIEWLCFQREDIKGEGREGEKKNEKGRKMKKGVRKMERERGRKRGRTKKEREGEK